MKGLLPLAVVAGFLGAGCGREPPTFEVDTLQPATSSPLRLNEPLEIRFTDDVDPSSVHKRSVQVMSSRGEAVDGRLETTGRKVTFRPRPVSEPTLDDGGLRLGEEVSVVLPGFPSRSGVRSSSGRGLAETFARAFTVVDADDVTAPMALFLDPDPRSGPRVLNRAVGPAEPPMPVAAGGWFVLVLSEPIWPASLDHGAIRLLFDDPDRTPVAAELRLKQDHDRAEVWMRPADGFQPGTRYLVDVAGLKLLDLGGNPMPGMWHSAVVGVPADEDEEPDTPPGGVSEGR